VPLQQQQGQGQQQQQQKGQQGQQGQAGGVRQWPGPIAIVYALKRYVLGRHANRLELKPAGQHANRLKYCHVLVACL
jgi:hypothetical protein